MVTEDPRFALVYDEALRGLVRQQDAVDELRARSVALLGAASIAAAFLGGLALDGTAIGGLAAVAIGAFATVGLGAVFVLWPRRWHFVTSARAAVAAYIAPSPPSPTYTLDQMRWELAEHFEDRYDGNERRRRRMRLTVTLQCLGLTVEVLSWLALLGTAAGG
jgi:hypothetical protein